MQIASVSAFGEQWVIELGLRWVGGTKNGGGRKENPSVCVCVWEGVAMWSFS